MARILVTGATGFVGRSLIPALTNAGHVVRCAVTTYVDWLKEEQVLVERLETHFNWSNALKEIDIVIHLAARVHIMKDNSESPFELYSKINTVATTNLAEQAAKAKVSRFIYLSSIKVNGEFTLEGNPFTETSIAQPEDPYGISKLQAEQALLAISAQTNMQIVILRPPLIYGPNVKANFLKMLGLVNKSLPLPFGRIKNKRSFIYLENLVSAICTVVVEPKAANQIFLVADDEALSLPELLTILGRQMDVPVRLLPVPQRLLSILFKITFMNNLQNRLCGSLEVSNAKIKMQLNWVPPYSSIEGLCKTGAWYKHEYNHS